MTLKPSITETAKRPAIRPGNPYPHPTPLRDWLSGYVEDVGELQDRDFPPPDFEELPADTDHDEPIQEARR
jgi:hypothetical protein